MSTSVTDPHNRSGAAILTRRNPPVSPWSTPLKIHCNPGTVIPFDDVNAQRFGRILASAYFKHPQLALETTVINWPWSINIRAQGKHGLFKCLGNKWIPTDCHCYALRSLRATKTWPGIFLRGIESIVSWTTFMLLHALPVTTLEAPLLHSDN